MGCGAPPLVGPCWPGPTYKQAACTACTKANISNEEICQGQLCDPNRPLSREAPAATETGAPRPCITGMGGLTGVPEGKKMKMKMIPATVFGGILAAGFLTVPAAHADGCADAMLASIRAGTPANVADAQYLACRGFVGTVANPPANFPDCQRLATPVEQAQCGDKHIAGQPYP